MTVTAARMKEIERKANDSGLSYYQMMENAGTAAYNYIIGKYPRAEGIIVLAGKGNNGGDGLVVARLAARDGMEATVVLVEGEPATADASANYKLLDGLGVDVRTLDGLDTLKTRENDIVVDAIYGTGFHGELRPAGRKACDWINVAEGHVAALDIPSGVNCDSGAIAEGAVRAGMTVSFHALKPAHEIEGSKKYCGEIYLADIGIHEQQEQQDYIEEILLNTREQCQMMEQMIKKQIEVKDAMIDKLHSELDNYRKGTAERVVDQMIRTIIKYCKEMEAEISSERWQERSAEELREEYEYACGNLKDLLDFQNVDEYVTGPLEDFDPAIHQARKREMTDDPALDRKVKESVSTGYKKDGRVLIYEQVSVYKYAR